MIVSTLSRTDPTPSTPFVCCDLAHALNLSVPGRGLPCLGLVATSTRTFAPAFRKSSSWASKLASMALPRVRSECSAARWIILHEYSCCSFVRKPPYPQNAIRCCRRHACQVSSMDGQGRCRRYSKVSPFPFHPHTRLAINRARLGPVRSTTRKRAVCMAMTNGRSTVLEAAMIATESRPPGLMAR